MKYRFFLGRHIDLSLAELNSLFKISLTKDKICCNSIVIDRASKIRPDLFERIAGTFKISLVDKVYKLKFLDLKELVLIILDYLKQRDFNRKYVGISFYFDSSCKNLNIVDLKKEIIHLYKDFTNTRLKFIGKLEDSTLSAPQEKKVNTHGGISINVLIQKEQKSNQFFVEISENVFIQDFKKWSRLDYNKPHRDMKIGMLPSKLAQIMINLAGLKKLDAFWDPFCGLGTLIMVGILNNMYSFGSDISAQALSKAEDNIRWLYKSGQVIDMHYKLFKFDIRENPLSNKILRDISKNEKFNAIVTEPFLGEIIRRPFKNRDEAFFEWQRLKPLYKTFLRNVSYLIPIEGKVVFVVPKFSYLDKGQKKWYNPKLEYSKVRWHKIDLGLSSLDWVNPKSYVAREIFILEKKR